MLTAEGPLPVYMTFVLGLVCIGIVFVLPITRGKNTRMICPDCGLSYRGRDQPCPHCQTGPCPACKSIVPLNFPTCPACGSSTATQHHDNDFD